jgi:tRNA (adenine57-N1/adenine58-N1)-methyltransferase catalytic subunit
VSDTDGSESGTPPASASLSPRAALRAGEAVLFIDRKERAYMRTLRPGARIHIRNGFLLADDLIGGPEGRELENSGGEPYLVLRPTYASLIPNLPRRAQVIYPKDVGTILLWGDIAPGVRVLEVGTGPGALTMALLRAVGPTGQVISYEIRQDFADMARANVRQFFGEAPNWTVKLADASQGIEERDLDRMVMDLAEPWTLLPIAHQALRPGAVLIAYVPTVLQVKQFVDQARAGSFADVQVTETLLRPWHVRGLSIRPTHRMVAHTGFVITCRRLADEPVRRQAGAPVRQCGGAPVRAGDRDGAFGDDAPPDDDDLAQPDTRLDK